jgi:hypothetical protein
MYSAFPATYPYRVFIAVALIWIIAWMNLRGVKESGRVFAVPTYGFVVAIIALVIVGFAKAIAGGLDPIHVHHATVAAGAGGSLGIFLLLHAFAGAVVVQGLLVMFYAAVARSLNIPIALSHLAVIVPVSFVVQMLPVSVNGFGVREATFSFYFSRLGLPIESAMAVSLGSTALVMLFSLSGAAVYVARRHPHPHAL